MKMVTIDEVRAAFELLEDHVAKQGVDADCLWAIHAAAEDVLAILSGEWLQVAPPTAGDGAATARAAVVADLPF